MVEKISMKNKEKLGSPIVGIGIVVLREGNFLLVKRAKEPNIGKWSIPGGKQKLGETIKQAVNRELKEETGVKIKKPILLDALDLLSLIHI